MRTSYLSWLTVFIRSCSSGSGARGGGGGSGTMNAGTLLSGLLGQISKILLFFLLLFLRQFLLDLRPHFYGFSGLSIGDVQSLRQLGEILVDVYL